MSITFNHCSYWIVYVYWPSVLQTIRTKWILDWRMSNIYAFAFFSFFVQPTVLTQQIESQNTWGNWVYISNELFCFVYNSISNFFPNNNNEVLIHKVWLIVKWWIFKNKNHKEKHLSWMKNFIHDNCESFFFYSSI